MTSRHAPMNAQPRMTDVWLPALGDAMTPEPDLVRPRWNHEYDRSGDQTLQGDPKGDETRFECDDLNRRTARVLPDGSRETWAYDTYIGWSGRRAAKGDAYSDSKEAVGAEK